MIVVISHHPSTPRHFFVYSNTLGKKIFLIHAFPRLPSSSSVEGAPSQLKIPFIYYLLVAITKTGIAALVELSYFILPALFELVSFFLIPRGASALIVQDPVTPLFFWAAKLRRIPIILSQATPCKYVENQITKQAFVDLLDIASKDLISNAKLDKGTSPKALVMGDLFYARRANGILCISSFAARTYKAISEKKIESYVPISILTEEVNTPPPISQSFDDPIRVLMVGHWTVRKGFYLALKAFQDLLDTDKFELIHLGLCTDPDIKKLSKQPGSGFRLLGHQPHQQALATMRNSDILLHPAYSEGAAYVILEAMHAGLAVLCSKNCIGPDVIEDGQTGIILPDILPSSIASKLGTLEFDRSRLLDIKRRAFEYSCSALTKRGCAETLSQALSSLGIS